MEDSTVVDQQPNAASYDNNLAAAAVATGPVATPCYDDLFPALPVSDTPRFNNHLRIQSERTCFWGIFWILVVIQHQAQIVCEPWNF